MMKDGVLEDAIMDDVIMEEELAEITADMVPVAELELVDDEENPIDPATGMRIQRVTFREIVIGDQQVRACYVPLMEKTDEPYPNNDKGNARRFLELEGARVRFCPEQKNWYVFDSTKWVPEEETRIRKMAQDALEQSYAEERKQLEQQKDYKKLEALERKIEKSGNVATIKNCVAKAAEEASIRPEEFDADGELFHAQNGTMDLRNFNGELYNISDSYFTKTANANWVRNKGDARQLCPLWHKFVLECCMNDESLYLYLQTAAGYSILTGHISEQKVFFLLGSGRNGKSLFINTLAHVAGDYACKVNTSVLCLNKYGDKDNDVEKEKARIAGCRFLYSNEFGRNSILNEAFIKEITDGGEVSARANYQDGTQYQPTYTLWISSNHMPNLQAMDEGIRRRVIIIPFHNHLKEDEVDRDLPEKLKAEADGILAWLLQGYMQYKYNKRTKKQALNMPDAVREATEGYFEEQDIFKRFVDEYYVIDENAQMKASKVYELLKIWCREYGEKTVNYAGLVKELTRIGVYHKKGQDYSYYGLRYKNDADEERFNKLIAENKQKNGTNAS